MVQFYGQPISWPELYKRIGSIEQVAGITAYVLDAGRGRGTRVLDVRNGLLNFQVLPDRGLDLGATSFAGLPLAWRSAVGPAHPAFYERIGNGWLRTFGGGLLTTAGLTQVGAPNEDAGASLGLHGEVSHIPVERLAYELVDNTTPVIRVAGLLYEGHPYGPTLERQREITTRVGSPTITIQDTVRNFGPSPVPLLVLYHFNFGYPLLSPTTEVVVLGQPQPRDPHTPPWTPQFGEATSTALDAVYYHTAGVGESRTGSAMVLNRMLDLGVVLRFDRRSLPELVEWREPVGGMYVLGLEPANCRVGGRAQERAAGRLRLLDPGMTASFEVEVEIAQAERLRELHAALVSPEHGTSERSQARTGSRTAMLR